MLLEPLSVESLGGLLSLSPGNIHSAIHRLQSVIAVTDADQYLRIQHPSFSDFIVNEHACPTRFLINRGEQHLLLARCCISVMNQLFNIREITKADITSHAIYALCYFDDHMIGAAPESRMEFLETIRTFTYSQVTKWLVSLFYVGRSSHAIPSIKHVYQWVVRYCCPHLIS